MPDATRHDHQLDDDLSEVAGVIEDVSREVGRRMTRGRVLVVGLDPVRIPGWDPAPVVAAIARGQARFDDLGIAADLCLVAPDGDAEEAIVAALTRGDYACVVVGGGIRKHEPLLLLFEKVVNLVRQHAPDAAIAFNTSPEDTADAALRWLH
ncbi:hypothetical protein [Micromonospora sp. NPDC023888]|uniref:hypothetical protein n=1 Tax=Micromonospora sp. NPDC023888 TaxID=3155607 RepID=UPI0033CF2F1C